MVERVALAHNTRVRFSYPPPKNNKEKDMTEPTGDEMREYMRKVAGDEVDKWDFPTLLAYYRQWRYGSTQCGCQGCSGCD